MKNPKFREKVFEILNNNLEDIILNQGVIYAAFDGDVSREEYYSLFIGKVMDWLKANSYSLEIINISEIVKQYYELNKNRIDELFDYLVVFVYDNEIKGFI